MENINIIVAISQNGVIGNGGDLLWHLSDDLKRFKQITSGCTVVMGRRTWESLPIKPLPDRRNIVLSRTGLEAKGAEVVHSIDTLKFHPSEKIFIIGGGEIYRQFLPYAKTLYITRVFKDFDGDTMFPEVNLSEYKETVESPVLSDNKNGLTYQYYRYDIHSPSHSPSQEPQTIKSILPL
ncbi:MAG: dihydrofolate reductase [Bacteroidales bacterium]|jgi:dihydrofolate reductase|nr:dihydrofolate reductase [Bacteroidales bacterium]